MDAEARALAIKAAQILDKKKAHALSVIEVTDVTEIADYFVICTGNSSTQVKSFADEVEFKLKQDGILPGHIEGHQGRSWIVMDYHSVVVHIFDPQARDFYDLEHLWQDGKKLPPEEYVTADAAEQQ